MKNEALSKLSPAIQDAIRVCREDLSDECDIDDGRAFLPFDADRFLVRLVERALESEYPAHGALLDAIRAEAACKPHTAEWFAARDAVTTEAMELADALRAANYVPQAGDVIRSPRGTGDTVTITSVPLVDKSEEQLVRKLIASGWTIHRAAKGASDE